MSTNHFKRKIDLEDHLKCPICVEIPRHEIVQCRNGHHLCVGCRKRLSKCPQCRIDYETKDIRNLGLESLLDEMEFQCPFGEHGCLVRVARKDLDSHEATCIFRPQTRLFCSRHLGWKDCQFTFDRSTVLSHLVEQHQIQLVSTVNSWLAICLKYGKPPSGENVLVYFDPVVVTSFGTPILLRTVMTYRHIVLTPFIFTNTPMADAVMQDLNVHCAFGLDFKTPLRWMERICAATSQV